MTTEARLAFLLFFFAVWCFVGLMTWVAAAVTVRGRGALLALPLALAAACATGVAVPLAGQRDAAGFVLSLATAVAGGAAGSIAGIALARRLERARRRPEQEVSPLVPQREKRRDWE